MGVPGGTAISDIFTLGIDHSNWCIPRIVDDRDISIFFLRYCVEYVGSDFVICQVSEMGVDRKW